jgi:serine/threonine-protein kinase RsbW
MIEYTRANGSDTISLEVPGILECRDMMLRTVSAACKLTVPRSSSRRSSFDELTNHVVSAVGEAYNNIVLHGYSGGERGSIHMRIEAYTERIVIVIKDAGCGFDPAWAPPPDLDSLPESGMGVFIMRSFVDEITYVPGPPNVLTLIKRLCSNNGGLPT